MLPRALGAALAIAMGLLAVPATAAQPQAPSDPARLWMHFDLAAPESSNWSDGVMNVQNVPAATYQDAHPGFGGPVWPIYVSPDVLPLEAQGDNYNHHHWLPIQYAYGLAGPIKLHWVFFAQTTAPAGIVPAAGVGAPLVAQLEARLDVVYGGGFDVPVLEPLALGRSPTLVLAGEASQGVEVLQVDGRLAYAVDVDLELDDIHRVVPGQSHFLRLGVDLVLPDTGAPDLSLLEEPRNPPAWGGWAVSTPDHPSYLDLATTDPLRMEDVEFWSVAGGIGVRARLLSPWGLPDFQPVDGPSMVHLDTDWPARLTYDPAEHADFHAKFNGYHTWSFSDPEGGLLEPGNHTVRFALATRDGSSRIEATYEVPVLANGDPVVCFGSDVVPGQEPSWSCTDAATTQSAPNLATAALASLLGLAVVLRRRHLAGKVRT